MSQIAEKSEETTSKVAWCRKPKPKLCDYCGEVPPEGYVPQYDAWVCVRCYEDHHGDLY